MDKNRPDEANEEKTGDGIDRRGFLKCMAWAGTGVVWMMAGGVMRSFDIGTNAGRAAAAEASRGSDFSFVQISDSHIGFQNAANPDVVGTLKESVARINAAAVKPAFLLHTGDLTHLSQEDQFDTLTEVLKDGSLTDVHYVPGEHDVDTDNGKLYLSRYDRGTAGDGYYSFDYRGVHFIGLNNVLDLKANGLGYLGPKQLAWLASDLRRRSAETPIVVFAHIPLWSVYPQWGWGTDDGAQALAMLRRFGSVTVLNGHIHQIMQKVEGNITFHTAMSTAFPQPRPGTAPHPGPLKVAPGALRGLLGVTDVNYSVNAGHLAVIDSPLGAAGDTGAAEVGAGDAH